MEVLLELGGVGWRCRWGADSEKADGAGKPQGCMRQQQEAGGGDTAYLKETAAAFGISQHLNPILHRHSSAGLVLWAQ